MALGLRHRGREMRVKHVERGRCPHCEAMIPHEGEPKPGALIERPSNSNQGSECGCRVYFDGWYKVAYCATHEAAPEMPEMLAFIRDYAEGCPLRNGPPFLRKLGQRARALLAKIEGKEADAWPR